MRIVCPNCAAVYAVPDDRLNRPRDVRCQHCDAGWRVPAVVPEPAPPSAPRQQLAVQTLRAPYPVPALLPPPPPERSLGLPAAWAASVLVLAGGIAVLLMDHRALAAAWPPLQRLYAVLGLSS
jgi:predicted Zn finger-like uncharacterized protein